MSVPLKVALLTEKGAPHLEIYLDCVARATGVQEAVVGDASEHIFEAAQQKLGQRFGEIPKYSNLERLFLERKPDLAIISFSAHHAPAAIETALRHGCHVLAEKPACVHLADFEALVNLARECRRQLMLTLATRMNPLAIKAREIVRNGNLGKLLGTNMYFLADQTRLLNPAYHKSWLASKVTAGGGHLIWLGIHYLDIIQFITGQRISKICGFIDNAGKQPLDVEDSASVSMQFDGGSLATLQSGYYLDRDYQSGIHMWGSDGWLNADLVSGTPLQWYSNQTGRIETFATDPEGRSNAYPDFVQAVIDSVRNRTSPPVTALESLQALRAVFQLYAAATSGTVQQLL